MSYLYLYYLPHGLVIGIWSDDAIWVNLTLTAPSTHNGKEAAAKSGSPSLPSHNGSRMRQPPHPDSEISLFVIADYSFVA